ncbi:hypothetical protein HNP81_000290 [Peribacillus huizhouensis]|uniref:Uncharacterized protein n=1 Tax=Peribacillus huizhouensis TaxID=1501239 RepID=A0ABR6CJ43_9BACI|nr:hypothetical protein [Peribacillus huizhouensis]
MSLKGSDLTLYTSVIVSLKRCIEDVRLDPFVFA